MYTHAQLIEAAISGLPYGDHCCDFDMSEPDALRFTWRREQLRVSNTGHVEERRNGCLCGSNLALLAGQCIKRALLEKMLRK